jgi:hypothetical protein
MGHTKLANSKFNITNRLLMDTTLLQHTPIYHFQS